jgi:hypothetical protein
VKLSDKLAALEEEENASSRGQSPGKKNQNRKVHTIEEELNKYILKK